MPMVLWQLLQCWYWTMTARYLLLYEVHKTLVLALEEIFVKVK